MLRARYLPLLLFIGIVINSCGKISQIEVGEINELNIKGFEGNSLVVELKVPVKNPTGHKISIVGINANLSINNNFLGLINSIDPVIIPRKSSSMCDLVIYVRLANPLGAAITVMNLHKGQKINIKLEGDFTAQSGLIKKVIKILEERDVVL
jgi:LEA14-like dessication related protein